MKILIYGAGVIGCELAHMLCKKNDVTLLARGNWKDAIEKNGLVIRHYVQRKTTVDRLKTIDILEPDDQYDLIFVVMQASQLPEVIPIIAKNASPHIVFVGNNLAARETARLAMTKSPVEKEIAFGFQGTAGRREKGKVISIHAGVGMTIGGCDAPLSQTFQKKLSTAFAGTGCRLTWENQMDAWLKCHATCVLPMCYVCYITDGRLPKATHRLRKAILDADLEGYSVLQGLGVPILPAGDEKWFSGPKRPVMAAIFHVRPYQEADLADCATCLYESLFTCPISREDRLFLQEYIQVLLEKCSFTFVAENDSKRVVGFICGKYSPEFDKKLAIPMRQRGTLASGG